MGETDEKKGYHKGSLECLLKERAELVKLVQIVTSLINMHDNNMKKLDSSFDLEKFAESVQVPLTSGQEIEPILKENKEKEPHEEDPNFIDFEEHLQKEKKDNTTGDDKSKG